MDLTIEQQFECSKFQMQAQSLTREQAIEALCLMYKSALAQKVLYNNLLKQQWGI